MDPLSNLSAIINEGQRKELKYTVLHRPNGVWHESEVARLIDGLPTEVSRLPKFPEYLILFGHFTKEETLKAIMGGVAYTATQVTGTKDLPFHPGF